MASQPSLYDEERNRLRLQAWEQRNQGTSQVKELSAENVPLFGVPYKTNRGDELSDRIQRMLGSYEDVNNPSDPSVYIIFTQPTSDKPGKPPVQDQTHHISSQTNTIPSSNGYPLQPMTDAPTAPSSPNHQRDTVTLPKGSLDHLMGQKKKDEASSDLREHPSTPQERSAQFPDVKPLPFLHSNDPKVALAKGTFDSCQESTEPPSAATTVDVSTFNLKQSPADASQMHQPGKSGNSLLSQNFPPLSSSKQPSIAMTQKPTAYVRPMDGQDQMLSGSPKLKPSPEPYVPLQEIHKANRGKTKVLPQYLETRTDEALSVEDILKEMTHSWPPLLTAIHVPNSDEAQAKEAEQVSSCLGQKCHALSSGDPTHLNVQSSSFPHKEGHSSGVESASSSDSDSSSRSDSDSEEPCRLPLSSSKTEPDAAAASHGDWQLGNWIRSSQQNSGNESQSVSKVCESPAHEPPQPLQSSKHSNVETTDPVGESKPPKDFGGNLPNVQPSVESSHESLCQNSAADMNGCTSSKKHSGIAHKPAKDHTEAAHNVTCEDAMVLSISDKPKVKTKMGRYKKSSDSKSSSERTFKVPDKEKTESNHRPEVVQVQRDCLSCGARHPDPCSCRPQNPARPDHPSPAPLVRTSCSKPNVEVVCHKEAKMIPKAPSSTTHKSSKKSGRVSKSSLNIHNRPVTSLLVKIDLSLLSRVPQVTPKNAERTLHTSEHKTEARKQPKASKKSLPHNAESDDRTLPRKKRKLEKKMTSSNQESSVKVEGCSNQSDDQKQKKAKKNSVDLLQHQKTKDSKVHKVSGVETRKDAPKSRDSCKHKSSRTRHTPQQKKPSTQAPKQQPPRPLLQSEDRKYPVKHYIKEAKRLKHKADSESDKLSKAFNYLDAAMFFVESGIAMEKDPRISMSSYTMFAETVELLKFVLKLKNSADPSAPPSEKDFVALCLKCQALLQMAMFRDKHKTALKYSKTLTDHFSNSTLDASAFTTKGPGTPSSPMASIPSPACSASKHGGSAAGPASATMAVPLAVQQVALSYINITMLVLSAHDLWEQAEEMASKGSGVLAELDALMGPVSLTSCVSAMVRYTRQGVLWLRTDSQKN
ncbi:AF4/FMR2 family member 1 isoform X2 [Dunckerocampus dactyliophorus]|uniref:AF4/FMR2 family member 1 isoform X2 n=1 Tax=Dunckerocampus dactyliophorus TaxID=161453 RepID=UPI002404D8E3|nr:AF4/FMR2 family member 1 isoform X2 [Dunckerocampus dactyliophorus]